MHSGGKRINITGRSGIWRNLVEVHFKGAIKFSATAKGAKMEGGTVNGVKIEFSARFQRTPEIEMGLTEGAGKQTDKCGSGEALTRSGEKPTRSPTQSGSAEKPKRISGNVEKPVQKLIAATTESCFGNATTRVCPAIGRRMACRSYCSCGGGNNRSIHDRIDRKNEENG